LPPPTITPPGGTFTGSVGVTLHPPDTNATLYYTLDGSLPTTSSLLYSGPFLLTSSAQVRANAFEVGFTNSVAASAQFTVLTNLVLSGPSYSNGAFHLHFVAPTGFTYVLQASTNLFQWVPVATNVPISSSFNWVDPGASNFRARYY